MENSYSCRKSHQGKLNLGPPTVAGSTELFAELSPQERNACSVGPSACLYVLLAMYSILSSFLRALKTHLSTPPLRTGWTHQSDGPHGSLLSGDRESNKPSDGENRAIGTQGVGKGKRRTRVKNCIRKAIGK